MVLFVQEPEVKLIEMPETSQFLPAWMTPEFLYRINYGPITDKDREKVASFLYDQYYGIVGRLRRKTMSSVCRRSWASILPSPWGRSAIRNVVPCPDEDDRLRLRYKLEKEDWSNVPLVRPHTLAFSAHCYQIIFFTHCFQIVLSSILIAILGIES